MAKTAKIHKKDGSSFECPIHAVKNFRRMIGDQIARVEILSDAGVEAPSVQPVEEEEIVEHPAANDAAPAEEVADEAPAKEEETETDGDKPNIRWGKSDLQKYLDDNHPDVQYQPNDTKKMLLAFIKSASK